MKARQLVLRELVPGGIERSLQLEQRQEVPRAPLVPHPGTFERTFALVDVDPLELFNGLQVLESRKCLLDIDQRGEDRLPIRCQQLPFAGQRLIALRAQLAVIENHLSEARRDRSRWASAADRVDGTRQHGILDAPARGEREARQHGGARGRQIGVRGLQIRLGRRYVRPPGEELRGQAGRDRGLLERIE